MFGLHDPMRKAKLPAMENSLNRDTFLAPGRSAYAPLSEAPYADTAQTALSFNMPIKMVSEQQSRFGWPEWTAPVKSRKPVASLTIA